MGVVILPKLRDKDDLGFSPEQRNILQLEAGYEEGSELERASRGRCWSAMGLMLSSPAVLFGENRLMAREILPTLSHSYDSHVVGLLRVGPGGQMQSMFGGGSGILSGKCSSRSMSMDSSGLLATAPSRR